MYVLIKFLPFNLNAKMPPECFLQFSIQQLKVFLKIEFREIFFHKTPNYNLSGSVIIKTLPDCSKSSWLPIWSRPRLFSVYHLLIIFDHSYLSAIVRFHKIKINPKPWFIDLWCRVWMFSISITVFKDCKKCFQI